MARQRGFERSAPAALLLFSVLALCAFPPSNAQGVSSSATKFASFLSTGISSDVAYELSLVNGKYVTNAQQGQVDVTARLTQAIQCTGRQCIDISSAAVTKAVPKIADVNARVMLWGPKGCPGRLNSAAGERYDPSTKDWASLLDACKALFRYEKRFASFFIRASYHDSLSVDVKNCPGPQCGGADASLLLNLAEMYRPENSNDDFSYHASRAAKKLASWFDVSVADTLAVCAAVAPEVLSGGRVKILNGRGRGLRVGRLDCTDASPPNTLPSPHADLDTFMKYWSDRGFNESEAIALMGSHALVDSQGCFNGPKPSDYCDPAISDCSNVRMFRWENHYYRDLCSPTIKIRAVDLKSDPPEPMDTPVRGMTTPELDAEARLETCKFTSPEGRAMAINTLRKVHTGVLADPNLTAPPEPFVVRWSKKNCTAGAKWGVSPSNCPHSNNWWYTPNDAFIGQACQDPTPITTPPTPPTTSRERVRDAARSFLSTPNWDDMYRAAFIKMVEMFATYASSRMPFYVNGAECYGGTHLEAACAQKTEGTPIQDTKDLWNGNYVPANETALQNGVCAACAQGVCPPGTCSSCVRVFNYRFKRVPNALVSDANCCGCVSMMRQLRYNVTSNLVVTMPYLTRFATIFPTVTVSAATGVAPAVVPAAPERVLEDDPGNDAYAPSLLVGGATSLADPPVTPYHSNPSQICTSTVANVNGFPSSPIDWKPFSRPFEQPPRANPSYIWHKPGTNLTTESYEINIFPIKKQLGCTINGVPAETQLLSYNGSVPGPTFHIRKGRQTLVRYNNQLTNDVLANYRFEPFHPCDGDQAGRQGRGISVHLHGEASLAPFDGWAEDTTCGGEKKDYYYSNRRTGFAWYHDHQLDITSENAYFGLAGMHVVTDSKHEGGCGEPWNLDEIPDTPMVLKDLVFDNTCELLYDKEGPHRNNLYGDVNAVNGIPWPVLELEPRWNRLRLLNAAVSRPYKLRVVEADTGDDVSGAHCKVIAGEGGHRRSPAPFPAAGIFIGVAERYEVVCDFSAYAGKRLYLWNAQDDYRMKDVPFFCHSHLVMRIYVKPHPPAAAGRYPVFNDAVPESRTTLDAVLTDKDILDAQTMVANKQCTRTFRFGRRHGRWVINGETWHSAKIAANMIGQNTWEVWCLETGGGWFHPIHIHLVDFYVLARNWNPALVHEYERWMSKDVVQLDPSSHVALLIRFGPHRGEYMFHCHNLVHEDYEMMRAYSVGNTTGSRTAATALAMQAQPTLIKNLDIVYDLYKDPVYTDAAAVSNAGLAPLTDWSNAQVQAATTLGIEKGFYRIFYPGGTANEPKELSDPTINPWMVGFCRDENQPSPPPPSPSPPPPQPPSPSPPSPPPPSPPSPAPPDAPVDVWSQQQVVGSQQVSSLTASTSANIVTDLATLASPPPMVAAADVVTNAAASLPPQSSALPDSTTANGGSSGPAQQPAAE